MRPASAIPPCCRSYSTTPASEIKNSLGNPFAKALGRIARGRGAAGSCPATEAPRAGPRAYRVAPDLTEVREAVKREWHFTRRAEAVEKSYRTQLQHYTVSIEPSRLARDAGDAGSKRPP